LTNRTTARTNHNGTSKPQQPLLVQPFQAVHPIQAIILAGGKGSRLQPLTQHCPKPLMPIEGRPILEWLLLQLKAQGLSNVTLALGHQAQQIQQYFGGGERWNMRIDYCFETEPLGTAGPLRLIDRLPDNFLVLNADILTTLNFKSLLAEHVANRRMATVAVHRYVVKSEFGVVHFCEQSNEITQFEEKPSYTQFVNMGVYAFNKAVLSALPNQKSCGIDALLNGLQAQQQPIHAFPFEGYWLDIGRPTAYQQAQIDAPSVLAEPYRHANSTIV
jgi:NDP-sugar pyrophosphorylase family protein